MSVTDLVTLQPSPLFSAVPGFLQTLAVMLDQRVGGVRM
jgi:hypothetical protein